MYHDAFQVYELLDKWNHRGPPNTEDVRNLFARDPSAAMQTFIFGQTLLHKCMEYYGNRLDLVRVLLDAYPAALILRDNNGYLPVHRALLAATGFEPSLELIRLLVESDESFESILQPTTLGAFPLHLACRRNGSFTNEIVHFLMSCFPDVVEYRDNDGFFPLNHALDSNDPQEQVIQMLVEQYPVALSYVDGDGNLPLHRVLERGRKKYDSVVAILVQTYPGALRFQNARGQTPLLLACLDDNPLSQVYSLVRQWPEQVTNQCELVVPPSLSDTNFIFNGELLPSALMSSSITVQNVREWVHRNPEVVISCDLQGRLPLHYACVSPAPPAMDVVQFLVSCSRNRGQDACSIADHKGRLPLHYAVASGLSEVALFLIDVHPEALRIADEDGRLPWHYGDCARLFWVADKTGEFFPDDSLLDDLQLVPEEIRWDILHVVPDSY